MTRATSTKVPAPRYLSGWARPAQGRTLVRCSERVGSVAGSRGGFQRRSRFAFTPNPPAISVGALP